MENEMGKSNFLDKIIDFIFVRDNSKWILLFLIIGFLLRLMVSIRIPFYADEISYAVHSIGFIDSGKLQLMDQDGIWFFITDLFTKFFGITVLGVRFFAILLGTASIILVYLLGKEIFDKNTGILSAIILSISSFNILFSEAQMDVPMAFFALFGVYFLTLFFKKDKKLFFLLAWSCLGIAIMIKQIAILFIPPFLIFFLYYNKKHSNNWKIQQIFYALLILLIFVTPILVNNYLLYKDKGLVDMQFSRFLGIAKEQYASIEGTLQPFSLYTTFIQVQYDSFQPSGIFLALKFLFIFESPLIFILSIFGLFLYITSNNEFKWLFILLIIFPFLFLAGTSLLPNHFVFTSLFMALFSAETMVYLFEKYQSPKTKKIIIILILFLILIGSLVRINENAHGFFGQNEIGKMINFKNKEISKNSLVVVDSRIYRGRIGFMFSDRHYLETNLFPELMNNMQNYPGDNVKLDVYFVEAVTDDSGWGSIGSQPEFNASTEQIVSLFKENAQLIGTVTDTKNQPHYAVYKTIMDAKSSVLEIAESTHDFYFYPVGLKPKEKVFDNYETYTLIDTSLNLLAHLIFYIEIILAFILIGYLGYLFFQEDHSEASLSSSKISSSNPL